MKEYLLRQTVLTKPLYFSERGRYMNRHLSLTTIDNSYSRRFLHLSLLPSLPAYSV